MNEVEKRYERQIDFVYVDTETSDGQAEARKQVITGVPTILLFGSDGERVYTLVGSGSQTSLEKHLRDLLAQE